MPKHLKFILFILAFLVSCEITFAENYFISNSGNDLNEGNSPVRPWRTIDKLNSFMRFLKPGDGVYFERGGYYSGQINLKASGDKNLPLVFGAYGEGNNPVISGAVPVKNWTVYKGNIYKAEIDAEVKNLFVNGKQQILARYPNSGFLKITKPLPDPNIGFYDKHLKQKDNYWTGSIARMRTVNWAYEYSEIKNFSKGVINLSSKTAYPLNSEWGYYIDNNLNELDTAGEWYFSKTGEKRGIIYLSIGKNQNINNIIMEASIYDNAFFSVQNLKNIEIKDLDIKYQYLNGVWFSGSKSNITIRNCRFINQYQIGINYSNLTVDSKIYNSRFYNIYGKALYILESYNTIISNNILVNIGMIPGYGTTGEAFGMSGIVILNSDSNHIFKNLFVNIGHDGINSIGKFNVIEKNVLHNTMLLLNDGSAIKCYGENTSNSEWRNNFIFNVPGNMDGTNLKLNHIAASGIYLDDKTNYMKVYDNTVTGCGLAGINLNNGCVNNEIFNNTCFDNKAGINFYQGKSEMKGNNFENNVICGISESQYFVQSNILSGNFLPAKFKDNKFINPYSESLFNLNKPGLKRIFNYSQWKKEFHVSENDNTKLFSGERFKFPKLLLNMSEDSSNVLLSSESAFTDINDNSLYGSVKLKPWSSMLVFSDKVQSNNPDITIVNGPLHFGHLNMNRSSESFWIFITGENLTDRLTISAPKGFKVSLQEEGKYENETVIIPVHGIVFSTVFVKFVPDEEVNYYDYIKIKSGKLNKSLKVSGNAR